MRNLESRFFRALETMALKELINDSERRVISLGSGLPLQEQNQKYLKELGTVVYLKGITGNTEKKTGRLQQRSASGWRRPG